MKSTWKKLLIGLALGAIAIPGASISNGAKLSEEAKDLLNDGSSKHFKNAIQVGSSDVLDVSPMFVQYGKNSEQKDCLRFAVALTGEIKNIKFVRSAFDGALENTKIVDTVYKGILSNGETVYYNPAAGTKNGLTNDIGYAGEYLWACYTIKFESDTYKSQNLEVTIFVDGEEKTSRTASLENVKAGNSDEVEKVDLDKKYGEFTQYDLLDGVSSNSMIFDYNNRGYRYETESSLVNKTSGNLENSNNKSISGDGDWGSIHNGANITYTIESDEDRDALLVASIARDGEAVNATEMMTVTYGTDLENLNKTIDLSSRQFTFLKGWTRFRLFTIGEVHLKKGANYINFTTGATGCNYDYIGLVRPWNDEVDVANKPIDYMKKYGTFAKDLMIDGSDTKEFSTSEAGYFYEAEKANFYGVNGIGTEDNSSASNGKVVNRFRYGDHIQFEINSNEKATVGLVLSMSTEAGPTFQYDDALTIRYGTSSSNLDKVVTNFNKDGNLLGSGFKNCRVHTICEVTLEKGVNYIDLQSRDAFNVDYMALVNEQEETANIYEKYTPYDKELLIDGSEKDSDNAMTYNSNELGYYYEAEKTDVDGGVTIESGCIKKFNSVTATVTLTIKADKDCEALLTMAATRWNDNTILLSNVLTAYYGTDLNNLKKSVNTEERWMNNHSNWDGNFVNYSIGEVKLKAGINYIKLVGVANSGGINIDYFTLVSPANKSLNSIYEYDSSVKQNGLVDGTSNMTFDLNNKGYFYEIENAALSSGIGSESGNSLSGGKGIGSFQYGRTAMFTIESNTDTDVLVYMAIAEGNYELQMCNAFSLRYGTTAEALDGQAYMGNTLIAKNGWSSYSEYMVGEIHLSQGTNYILLTSKIPVNLDYMCLIAPNA